MPGDSGRTAPAAVAGGGRPARRGAEPAPGERFVSATLYYSLVTLLLVVLIGGMALGLAVGCRLVDRKRE